jgi:hypothetical protein
MPHHHIFAPYRPRCHLAVSTPLLVPRVRRLFSFAIRTPHALPRPIAYADRDCAFPFKTSPLLTVLSFIKMMRLCEDSIGRDTLWMPKAGYRRDNWFYVHFDGMRKTIVHQIKTLGEWMRTKRIPVGKPVHLNFLEFEQRIPVFPSQQTTNHS